LKITILLYERFRYKPRFKKCVENKIKELLRKNISHDVNESLHMYSIT